VCSSDLGRLAIVRGSAVTYAVVFVQGEHKYAARQDLYLGR
jgi:hypothetical protein